MKTRHKILPAVCCIALLSACASNQKAVVAPESIVPISTVKNSSDRPEAMYQMGRYYQGQNRFDQAISAYQKALAADASFVEARNGLGVIYSRQGKYREAIDAFQAAIKLAPKAAHLYSNIGYAYYLQGQYAESVAALEQATQLDPANLRAFNNLGLAYAKAGSKTESVVAFSKAADVVAISATSPVKVNVVPSSETASAETNGLPSNKASEVQAGVQQVAVLSQETQTLILPKDRGVIRPALNDARVAQVESRVKLVQLAQNVSELHMQQSQEVNLEQVAVATSDYTSTEKTRIEVANGNGVNGMAGKVGKFLRNQGHTVARITNQKPFRVQMTQIQYRDGHQMAAQLLQSSLPTTSKLVLRNDMRADVGVRLVLGKDVSTQVAHFDGGAQRYQLVRRLDIPAS